MNVLSTTVGRLALASLLTLACLSPVGQSATSQFGTPKGEEGTRIFKATEHPNYSGLFRVRGDKATLVGSMQDRAPWDHLDYAGKNLTDNRRGLEPGSCGKDDHAGP